MGIGLGLRMFSHSLGLVFRNIPATLRICLVPAVIVAAALLTHDTLSPHQNVLRASGKHVSAGLANIVLLFWVNPLISLMMLAAFVWISVNCHRFVLLDERPIGWVPPFPTDLMLIYLRDLLILGSVVFALVLPVAVGAVLFGAEFRALPIGVIWWLLVLPVLYRLFIMLPAAAIGQAMDVWQTWCATSGYVLAISTRFVVSFGFQLVLSMVFDEFSDIPFVGTPVALVVELLVQPLINVSILTTMYGVLVEHRPLN